MRGRLAAFNKQDRDFSGLYDEKVVYKQITKFTQYFIFSNRYKDFSVIFVGIIILLCEIRKIIKGLIIKWIGSQKYCTLIFTSFMTFSCYCSFQVRLFL